MTAPLARDPLIEHLLIILPILAGIALKLSGVTLTPRMMMKALETLLATSRLAKPEFALNEDQRTMIIDTVSNEALKTTTILSYFIALFDAALVLATHVTVSNVIVLSIFAALLLFASFYLLPKHPLELSERGWFNSKFCNLIIYSLCVIDLAFGLLSLRT